MQVIYLILSSIFLCSCSKKITETSSAPVLPPNPILEKVSFEENFLFKDLRVLDGKDGKPIVEPRITQPSAPPHAYPKSEYPEAPKVTASKKTSKVDGYLPKEKPKAKSSKKPAKKKRPIFDFFFKK